VHCARCGVGDGGTCRVLHCPLRLVDVTITDLQEAVGVAVGHDVISNSNILRKIVEHLMCYHHLIRSMTVTPDVLLSVIASPRHTTLTALYFHGNISIIIFKLFVHEKRGHSISLFLTFDLLCREGIRCALHQQPYC
jgi:hypothetical protein